MNIFEIWVREVRDPARISNEGQRKLRFGKAILEYEIAPLPCGKYALCSSFAAKTSWQHSPWEAYQDRDTAIEKLLANAREFFSRESKNDQGDCQKMVDALSGMFFVEPEVN